MDKIVCKVAAKLFSIKQNKLEAPNPKFETILNDQISNGCIQQQIWLMT